MQHPQEIHAQKKTKRQIQKTKSEIDVNCSEEIYTKEINKQFKTK